MDVGINKEEEEYTAEFLFDVTIQCYCGKMVDIKYSDDEDNNIRQTICQYCFYNHIDLIYETRKEMENIARGFMIKK